MSHLGPVFLLSHYTVYFALSCPWSFTTSYLCRPQEFFFCFPPSLITPIYHTPQPWRTTSFKKTLISHFSPFLPPNRSLTFSFSLTFFASFLAASHMSHLSRPWPATLPRPVCLSPHLWPSLQPHCTYLTPPGTSLLPQHHTHLLLSSPGLLPPSRPTLFFTLSSPSFHV